MPEPTTAPLSEISEATVRGQLADRMWQGMLVLAVLGIPTSLIRILITGWQPLYALHTVIAVLVFLIALYRRHLPPM